MATENREPGGTIVFGDDGSSPADAAWLWINNQSWAGWNLEVITATEPPLTPPSVDREPDLIEWDSPFSRTPLPQAGLGQVRFLTAVADPRILLGRRSDADVMVVGTKGLNPLQALLLGSTTEWLLQDPPAPLVVARSAARVGQALVAVDGSSHARRAVEAFALLPWAGQASVLVLAVDDGRTDLEAISVALDLLHQEGIDAEGQQAAGRPTDVILEQIELRGPELVVLGTRGLTGLDRPRLGSTAAAVIRHGPCSVLAAAD